MEKKKLTKEIIKQDLKKRLKTNFFLILLTIILVLLSIEKVIENKDTTSIFFLVLTTFFMIVYIGHFLLFMKSYIIQESIVENIFYDEERNMYKILVQGFKKPILSETAFQVGETVYAIVSKRGILLHCYSKNDYVL